MQLANRDQVVQMVLVNEVIMKRQLSLDHLIEGLRSLGFYNVMRAFPDIFEPLFVVGSKNAPTTECIINMLKKKGGASSEIFEWMKQYIRSLDDNGWFVCILCNTLYIAEFNVTLHAWLSLCSSRAWHQINASNLLASSAISCKCG